MRFLEYQELLLETSLEKLSIPQDGRESLILMHEIEYKLHKFNDLGVYSFNPRLLRNVTKRFVDIYAVLYEDVARELTTSFDMWLENHQFGDIDAFTDTIFEDIEDYVMHTDEISRGMLTIKLKDHYDIFSEEDLNNILFYTFGQEDAYIAQYYNNKIVDKLINNNIYPDDIEDESEARDYWHDYDEEAYEEYQNHFGDIEPSKEDLLDIVKTYDFIMLPDEYVKKIIKKVFIPMYMERYNFVWDIIHEAEEAKERIEKSEKYVEDAENIADNLGEEITQKELSDISSTISKATSAISLGLNVFHSSGNIMADYSGKYNFIDNDFLDKMSNINTSEWDEEINRLVRRRVRL